MGDPKSCICGNHIKLSRNWPSLFLDVLRFTRKFTHKEKGHKDSRYSPMMTMMWECKICLQMI